MVNPTHEQQEQKTKSKLPDYLLYTGIIVTAILLFISWPWAIASAVIFFIAVGAVSPKPVKNDSVELIQPKKTLKPGQQISSIEDLFSIDFLKFNPAEYNYLGESVNGGGQTVKKYRKVLPKKEAGLFDVINVNYIEGNMNYTFENGTYSKFDLNAIQSLVSSIYYLLGKDTSFNGQISPEEKDDFTKNIDPHIHRSWMDDHLSHPVTLSFENDGYEITIFGFKDPNYSPLELK